MRGSWILDVTGILGLKLVLVVLDEDKRLVNGISLVCKDPLRICQDL